MRRIRLRPVWLAALLGTSAMTLAVSCSGQSEQRTVTANTPRGDQQGLALLRRVHAAYRDVPAVETTSTIGASQLEFLLLLKRGVATAEEFESRGPGGTTVLVARGDGPTYVRQASRCWRRLARGSHQSLSDIGFRFPDGFRMHVGVPRRSRNDWLLPVETVDPSGATVTTSFAINTRTMMVGSEIVHSRGHAVFEQVRALTRQPQLANPKPVCGV